MLPKGLNKHIECTPSKVIIGHLLFSRTPAEGTKAVLTLTLKGSLFHPLSVFHASATF